MLVRVEDYSDLRKDSESGAIINTNRAAASAARIAKQAALKKNNRLEQVETELAEIKQMLKQLLEK
jgi:hypothetical protein